MSKRQSTQNRNGSECETLRHHDAQSLVHSWKLFPVLDLIQCLGLGARGVGHLAARGNQGRGLESSLETKKLAFVKTT